MAYFKPYIDETGYHYPTCNDILEYLIDRMQTIYGSVEKLDKSGGFWVLKAMSTRASWNTAATRTLNRTESPVKRPKKPMKTRSSPSPTRWM